MTRPAVEGNNKQNLPANPQSAIKLQCPADPQGLLPQSLRDSDRREYISWALLVCSLSLASLGSDRRECLWCSLWEGVFPVGKVLR